MFQNHTISSTPLVRQCQLSQLVCSDRGVHVIFHGELSFALSHGPQAGAVAKHLSQWNVSLNNNLISLCLTVLDQALPSVDIANDCALELTGRTDLQTPSWAVMMQCQHDEWCTQMHTCSQWCWQHRCVTLTHVDGVVCYRGQGRFCATC